MSEQKLVTFKINDRELQVPAGTLVIEAAMKAMHIAPGLSRPSFGFQRWPQFDGKAWQRVVAEVRKETLPSPPFET